MKVIHLISGGDTGGAKTHIHYLLSGICKNIDATLVCFMRGEFSDEAQQLGIPTVVLEGNLLKTLRQLKVMIKEGGYDLIHSHGARGNVMALLLRRHCKIPVVTTIHSDPKLDYLGRPLAGLVYGTLNSVALNHSDYLVGVSDSMKELLISRGFAPNDIYTIYNGVDFSVVPKNDNRLEYLRSLGLQCDEDSVVVGIAARLDPVKDLATLIRGFAQAEKSCPKLRLIIAGEGQERSALEQLSKDLKVEEKVCFAGWIGDINTFFAALSINTLTSLSETFPYALTEGARAGVATVASRVGGVPKLIKDGQTGFLFPAGDPAVLGRHLQELAENDVLRRQLGKNLYEKAKREFSVEATTATQLEIYRQVLLREEKKKQGQRDGVIICGAYGMGNAGDDAILEAIVGEMREIDPFIQISALSRHPKETKLRYFVNSVHMFNFPAFRRIMKGTKLYISGGGSLIQNVTSRRSLWYYLYTISSAKKLGNKVMMYGCGIGPLADKRDESTVSRKLNQYVDVITLREQFSLLELQRLEVTKPKLLVSSDPALTLPCAPADRIDAQFRKYALDPKGAYICFSVRQWTEFEKKAEIFAQAADFAAQTLGLTPVFMLINYKEDNGATSLVCSQMKTKAEIISQPMDADMTIGVLSRMRAVVSMRLHGLIFAASQGVPLVGVSYDPKVTAFLKSAGEERCIQYDKLDARRLKELVESAVTDFEDIEGRRASVERLISAEALNSQMASELLKQ